MRKPAGSLTGGLVFFRLITIDHYARSRTTGEGTSTTTSSARPDRATRMRNPRARSGRTIRTA
jgi:hypothetical protein